MTCAEFQRVLPEIEGWVWNQEQASHLRTCVVCSSLVTDLEAIVARAPELVSSDDPDPRVWNRIRLALEKIESELELIARQAESLQASDEPSPWVWNSIE